MSGREATIGLIILVAVACVLYDLFAYERWDETATISYVMFNLACRHPIIPFALGAIFGHLFWPQLRP